MNGLVIPYDGNLPEVSDSAFIAPDVTLVGNVRIGPETGVWYKSVLRGDGQPIIIGANCNIQDGTVIHVAGKQYGTTIGDNVTVGHMALIHACTLESDSFVSMRAVVMDGAVVESGAMVATGAVVTPGKRVPSGEVWAGVPAAFMRPIGNYERDLMTYTLCEYNEQAKRHQAAIEAPDGKLKVVGTSD